MAEAWGLSVCSTVVAHALLSPSLAVSRAQLLEGDPFPPKYRVICASGGGQDLGGHTCSGWARELRVQTLGHSQRRPRNRVTFSPRC